MRNPYRQLLIYLITSTTITTLASALPSPPPNPSLLPSNLTSPTSSTINDDDDDPVPSCFHSSQLPFPHSLLPVTPYDAYSLLTSLTASFAFSPVPFNTAAHPVPQIWTRGTAMMTLARLSNDAWDVFSELQVAKALAGVVLTCVTRERGWLGGKMAVGPRGMFAVAVLGRGSPTGEEGVVRV